MLMLIIGDSEADIFRSGQDYLKREWNIDVKVDSSPWRPLVSCPAVIRRKMTADVDVVMIWALTSLAWVKKRFFENNRSFEIMVPSHSFTLRNVAAQMEEIVTHVKSLNPRCRIFLVIPAIKDLYKYNQECLARDLGEDSIHLMENHSEYNQQKMRDHSVVAFNKFEEMTSNNHYWPHKRFLKASNALNRCYSQLPYYRNKRTNTYPHVLFLQKRSQSLAVECLKDGFHGNQTFLLWFMKSYHRLLLSNATRESAPSLRNRTSLASTVNQRQYTISPERIGSTTDNSVTSEVRQSREIAWSPDRVMPTPDQSDIWESAMRNTIEEELTFDFPLALKRRMESGLQELLADIVYNPSKPTKQDELKAIKGLKFILTEKEHIVENRRE